MVVGATISYQRPQDTSLQTGVILETGLEVDYYYRTGTVLNLTGIVSATTGVMATGDL